MRRDHELSIPELVAKIEELVGYIRIKSYGEGFEEGRKFEREVAFKDAYEDAFGEPPKKEETV